MDKTEAAVDEIPVFPLGTVLFPDGVLPLRVFEARYMDMVRDCLKKNTQFGVCLITDGAETGKPANHEHIGCAARIDQWDMEQLGLLNIRTIGTQRFEVLDGTVQTDGLKVAQVRYLDAEPDQQVPDEHQPCVQLLERIVSDLADKESNPIQRMIEHPCQFESASWVSNRLCEFLPIPTPFKQKLMVFDDPIARLEVVHEYLRQQSVV
jgi:Lon protease-like protein